MPGGSGMGRRQAPALRWICTPLLLVVALCCLALLAAPARAAQILVVDVTQADAPTQMLVASIQGVVNRPAPAPGTDAGAAQALPPQVYVIRAPQDAVWLSLYRAEMVPVKPDELVAKVRDRLAGQVLYDPTEQHSYNLAAAAAAVLDAALTPTDVGLKTLLDVRNRWPDRLTAYRYAVAQVMAQSAPDRLALIGPDRTDLRDYLARDKVLAVDLDWHDPEQAALLREILARLEPGALILGAPELTGDDELLRLLAQPQDVLVPISQASNLSFHAGRPLTEPLRQPEHVSPPAYEIMVTFVYEGGADAAFALGRMRALWDDPARGTVPIGWTISPALLDLAPPVIQSYYVSAATAGADELVLAPNGAGFFAPSRQVGWDRVVERMTRWAQAGEFRVAALADTGAAADLEKAISHYKQAGMRGLLLGPGAKLASAMYQQIPVIGQAVRATDANETLKAIRRAGRESKYIYVSVDPWSVTPGELAQIARRLGRDYLVLRPSEFMEVARETFATGSNKPAKGSAEISGVSVRPAQPGPQEAITVRATVRPSAADTGRPQAFDSVRAIYTVTTALGEWSVPLEPEPDNRYVGALPPVLQGGQVSMRVRAVDVESGITWSEPVSVTVIAPDADKDGLSDAAERLARTDPANPDTDGDGWRDGNDAHPLLPDRFAAIYLWPVAPPGDAAYIGEAGRRDAGAPGGVSEGTRVVQGGQQVVYKLPLAGAPAGSRAALEMLAGGDYRIEASADGKAWQEAGAASSADSALGVVAWAIPQAWLEGGRLWVRVTSRAPNQTTSARVAGLSVSAAPDGPSLLPRGTQPAYPATGQPMTVLASVFSPQGVTDARLFYRINGSGSIGFPMSEVGRTQVYAGDVRGALNGDEVTYWVAAVDGKGNRGTTRPYSFRVGATSQETISLLPARDCEGEWQLGAEWDGSRWSPRAGAVDRASINIIGGAYRVWVLAAPRGGGLRISLDGREVGTVAGMPDGWQSVATIDLSRGKHEVTLTSVDGARCGYAQVLITRDRSLIPPEGLVCDLYNTLTALAPAPGQIVRGLVDIEATGTGNIGAVECSVDGVQVGRQRTPPYRFRWNARRAAAGPHAIELRALDQAGGLLLTTGMSVEVR